MNAHTRPAMEQTRNHVTARAFSTRTKFEAGAGERFLKFLLLLWLARSATHLRQFTHFSRVAFDEDDRFTLSHAPFDNRSLFQ